MKKTPPKAPGVSKAPKSKKSPKTAKRATPDVKNEGGRPTKYRATYAVQVFKLCLLGATDKDMAAFFDVCEATINTWKGEHPKFLDSIRRGRDRADAEVANSLYRRALGYSHPAVKINQYEGVAVVTPYTEHYPPDTPAASLWLRNRQPERWRDKVELVGGSRPEDPAIALTVSSYEENKAAALAKLRQIVEGAASGAD